MSEKNRFILMLNLYIEWVGVYRHQPIGDGIDTFYTLDMVDTSVSYLERCRGAGYTPVFLFLVHHTSVFYEYDNKILL